MDSRGTLCRNRLQGVMSNDTRSEHNRSVFRVYSDQNSLWHGMLNLSAEP
jgi:hypothetical protein